MEIENVENTTPTRKPRGKDAKPRKRRTDKHAGPGRPPSGPESRNDVLPVAVTPRLKTWYEEEARAAGTSRSDIAGQALEDFAERSAMCRRMSAAIRTAVQTVALSEQESAHIVVAADVFTVLGDGRTVAIGVLFRHDSNAPMRSFTTAELAKMTDIELVSALAGSIRGNQ